MHYLDYAATTPVPAQVAEVMVKVLTEDFGNPSAQYPLGRAARDLAAPAGGIQAGCFQKNRCRPAAALLSGHLPGGDAALSAY